MSVLNWDRASTSPSRRVTVTQMSAPHTESKNQVTNIMLSEFLTPDSHMDNFRNSSTHCNMMRE